MTKDEKAAWGFAKKALVKADRVLSKPYDQDEANETREFLLTLKWYMEMIEQRKKAA